MENLLFGLGIRQVGKKAAGILAARFLTMDALMAADTETLTAIRDIGEITAQSIAAFFAEEKNRELISHLKAFGPRMSTGPRRRSRKARSRARRSCWDRYADALYAQ